ncbi:MAG: 50S ribosomal protein L5 [Candidatus Moranbacteria bacterium GW2011_GWC1_45_18]|nr:MAG: 50S ribosomal protein L5 [Candidatus Moranbacteria bacterium GW2011_GWC2_40_12]KKT33879.1 MAG: 50S ribosomal protein L5 [Candidatus Moranbacteria bacterium GW2011_GWF2_44_10]KKT69643.1 MAG: 50S ribosomal protein L5 [Candidatus Moranbacteria bacterium GW2011_GWF1_44_4]KKT99779.1 MAG: 50S ribosomal protein L5 [Candidatus Moranbacteria bacterium GW2011_GWC1_45_18]OGI23897.1 MAG: 50S ribosomal protein L5 [Candidatus Moranbacteria bacterium RIFOXYA1_FULL_44_8]OGI39521.1 MAG: 50S ribosomal p
MSITLKEKYNKDAAKKFQEKFGARSVMAVPRITKVVINAGIGKFLKEKDAVDEIISAIRDISGQKPVMAKAKKSISGFKVREGQDVGIVVTLRGRRMWDFLERLVKSAFPRIRDFQGIDTKFFDKQGNFNIALKEHFVFPEIMAENVKNIFGFQVTVVNTAKTKEEGIGLLRLLGFPIKSE